MSTTARACPSCGKKVSPMADKCPSCGHPAHMKRETAFAWIGLVIAIVLFFVVKAALR